MHRQITHHATARPGHAARPRKTNHDSAHNGRSTAALAAAAHAAETHTPYRSVRICRFERGDARAPIVMA